MAAWLIHLYTASGGVIGMFALFSAAEGKPRTAFLLLVVSMLIDATDGIMARRIKISEVLPDFQGARIDNLIDMLNFVWVPVFIMWSEELIPHAAWTIVPVITALYVYGQTNMKSDEDFFVGFPSYWSLVALYLYWLAPSPIIAVLFIAIPAVLSFIPTRYLYPSKNTIFWKTSWGLGFAWFIMIIVLLFQENPSRLLIWLSLYYPIYYLTASFYVEYKFGPLKSSFQGNKSRKIRSLLDQVNPIRG